MHGFLTIRCLAAVAGVLVVAGCAAPPELEVSVPQPVAEEEVRIDIKGAITGIVQTMRGVKPGTVDGIRFDPGAVTSHLVEPGFAYEGFALTETKITEYGQPKDDPDARTIEGFLNFEDAYGRRNAVRFEAGYRIGADSITFTKVAGGQVYISEPAVEVFIVPSTVVAGGLAATKDYGALYKLVVENAVSPKKPASVPKGKHDYIIFGFFKNRVSPTAKVDLRLSDQSATAGGYNKGVSIHNFRGWPVTMMPARFKLHGDAPLYAKVVYKPGKELGAFQRQERLVGLYALGKSQPAPEISRGVLNAEESSAIVSQRCIVPRLRGNKSLPVTVRDRRFFVDPCDPKKRTEGLAKLTPAEANEAWTCLRDELQDGWEKSSHPIVNDYLDWQPYTNGIFQGAAQGGCYMEIVANADGAPYGRYEKSGLLPYGTRIVKGTFAGTQDGKLMLGTLLTMEKLIGKADTVTSGSWRFTHILADGNASDSQTKEGMKEIADCISCHRDAKFGDFVFFPPKLARRKTD